MFTTKKYTRPLLASELKKVSPKYFTNISTLAAVVSPRAGTKSAKINALYAFLGGKNSTNKIFNSHNSTRAIKSVLLSNLSS